MKMKMEMEKLLHLLLLPPLPTAATTMLWLLLPRCLLLLPHCPLLLPCCHPALSSLHHHCDWLVVGGGGQRAWAVVGA